MAKKAVPYLNVNIVRGGCKQKLNQNSMLTGILLRSHTCDQTNKVSINGRQSDGVAEYIRSLSDKVSSSSTPTPLDLPVAIK